MKNDLNLAIRLAVQYHAGQLDKTGQPYILHPLRVGAAGANWREQIVGFLHDTLEDTDLTFTMLEAHFTPEIVAAILSVTRQSGENYEEYICRADKNGIGRAVKINDLKDNMSRLCDLAPDERESLGRRYRHAMVQLGVEDWAL